MSAENVEVVLRGYDHFRATGDFLAEIMAPDYVWDMSTFVGWPEQQEYHGVEGARQFLAEWTAPFEQWRIEQEQVIDAGEHVVVILHQRGRHRTTGMPVDMRLAQVFTVRDGLQVRMEMYADPEEALAAAGVKG